MKKKAEIFMNTKRLIALDYGDRRIGIAVSDLLGITAQPVGFLTVDGKKDALLKLKEVFLEYEPYKVVLGLPKNMDGSEGERAEKTRRFARFLTEETGLETDFFDERLTTVYAERTLNSMNVKGKKKTGKKDSLSAVLILQGYMETQKN